jgi:coproporphyrinogen III oxidase-like Fe-S oxidoreductase
MRLTANEAVKFDSFLPMYNWLYPLSGVETAGPSTDSINSFFLNLPVSEERALYFHIPFCQTICTFCPFVRATFDNPALIDTYLAALIKEIRIKTATGNATAAPINAIFIGGGTPSLLNPHQIRQLGRVINDSFDLTRLREFSFEIEVKSLTPERIDALQDIGVTHPRFGLQTFSSEYRRLFNLTATLDQIYSATDSLLHAFPFLSCDILYGMNGQAIEDLAFDIDSVTSLGIANIDLYPINNLMTQPALHSAFRTQGKAPLSGFTKFYMNMYIRQAMAAKGYLPHNGHGYVKVSTEELDRNPVVTDTYSFTYHENVYGFPARDLLGFGTNAVSSFSGYTTFNTASRSDYIGALEEDRLPMTIRTHGSDIDAARSLALALPYHGRVPKQWIRWDAVPSSLQTRFSDLIDHDLVTETDEMYELTHDGWHWYSNVMYYLLPDAERHVLDHLVEQARHEHKKSIETSGLEGFSLNTTITN